MVSALEAISHAVRIDELGAEVENHPGLKRYQYIDIERHHVTRRDLDHTEDARPVSDFVLPLKVFQKQFNLRLTPATGLFSANVQVQGKPFNTRGFYRGTLMGHPGSFAHVHVRPDGMVSGTFYESLESDSFFIRPSDSAGHASHIVYQERRNESVAPEHSTCGVDGPEFPAPPAETGSYRRRRAVSATPWVAANDLSFDGFTYCEMAMFGDRQFMSEYGTGSNSVADAVAIMIERFSVANAVFTTLRDDTADLGTLAAAKIVNTIVWLDYYVEGGSNTADAVEIDGYINGQTTTRGYLESFSRFDWSNVCLAHSLTYKDFEGTLGLAWTAYPNSQNHNGGICQARYNDGGIGGMVSLNTAWSSSHNFGAKQTELQSALVLAHELGHNYGSGHDEQAEGANGDYVMYKFAVTGNEPNNDNFSPNSQSLIQAAMTDRAGCFVNSSGQSCGNAIVEGDEVCDSGGQESIDECCSTTQGECELRAGFTCSPLNTNYTGCCENCLIKTTGACGVETECRAQGQCNAGGSGCDDGAAKPDGTLCEPGLLLSGTETGSLVCSSGSCSDNVCDRLGLSPCVGDDSDFGSGACELHCRVDSTCTPISSIASTYSANLFYADGSSVLLQGGSQWYKPAGAACEHLQGEPISGVCTEDNPPECISADAEEDTLEELFRQYNELKDTFLSWVNQERGGVPVWGWLILAGIILVVSCCGGCYAANKPAITEFKDEVKDIRRQRSERRKSRNPDAPLGI